MKKSKMVTLALVSSLTIISCSEKEEKAPQKGSTVHGWSNSNDTVVSASVHRGGISPFLLYYGAFGMYSRGNYHEAVRVVNRGTPGRPSFHSYTSPSGKSSFSHRGGFGTISSGRSSVS
jgi:hypothetical protein